jgi:hypothetical protein
MSGFVLNSKINVSGYGVAEMPGENVIEFMGLRLFEP